VDANLRNVSHGCVKKSGASKEGGDSCRGREERIIREEDVKILTNDQLSKKKDYCG